MDHQVQYGMITIKDHVSEGVMMDMHIVVYHILSKTLHSAVLEIVSPEVPQLLPPCLNVILFCEYKIKHISATDWSYQLLLTFLA